MLHIPHKTTTLTLAVIISSLLLTTIPVLNHAQATDTQPPLQITLTFTPDDFTFDTLHGYDRATLPDDTYLATPGQPMLPTRTIHVALPTGLHATSLHLIAKHETTLPHTYTIYPTQRPHTLDDPNTTFLPPDPTIYTSTISYPSAYVTLDHQTDLAGQAIADLTIYPLHYTGALHRLTLLTSLTFTITGPTNYTYGDYLPTHHDHAIADHIKDLVINPDAVQLQTQPQPHTTSIPPGNYTYVIITQNNWVSAFQPLADWKTKKGVPATIVTTDWIYSEYSGSSNAEKIRAFIQDAYTNWGTLYILLGGDTGTVPCNYQTFPNIDSDPVPNDTYYADFDGDWTIEVNVGRASVTGPGSSSGQIGCFTNKVLTYEQNPPLTDFATHAGFFGFDLDSSTHGEQCKTSINNTYIPDNWTVTTVYDSQSGNHLTNVIAAINAGQNLLNHADHSGSDFMGTGYVNHNIGLDDNNMDGLTNGDHQGILYSMGCDPCAYDTSACIAEHYVRNANGGGIAFIGNSRYGWYNPGNTNTLSMKFDKYFFRAIFNQGIYNLGAAFSNHKDSTYTNDDYYKYCYTELTLLGDPELPIWTADPQNLVVNYPTQLPVGTTDFTVTVTTDGGSPINNAVVCLLKDTDVYQVGTTDATGSVTLTVSPTSLGTMYVTVTSHNYLPSENTAYVTNGTGAPPEIPTKPSGPTNGETNKEYTYSTSTTDPDGEQVWYQWQFGSSITDWIGPYDSGETATASHTWTSPGIFNVKVKAKDETGFQSSWSPALPVTIIELKANLTLNTMAGGFLKITSELGNDGTGPATNLSWSITVTGPFVLKGHYSSGTIPSLGIGETQQLKTLPLIGFGPVDVTVDVSADGIQPIEQTGTGYLLLIWASIQ